MKKNELTLDHMTHAWDRAIKTGAEISIKSFVDEEGFLNYMLITFERIDYRTGRWKPPVANDSQEQPG